MIKIYSKTQQVYDAMLASCRNAKREILFEQYIFEDYYPGGIGAEFLEVFLKKAAEGVRVVLNIDALGSLHFYNDGKLQEKLRNSNIELHFYKHLSLRMFPSLTNIILRNHTKLLILDKKEVWIGGVIVGDKYRNWEDLMLCYQNEKIAKHMHRHFFRQLKRCEGRRPFRFKPYKLDPETELLGNSPGFKNRFISKRIHSNIKRAKKSITIISPYFSPPINTWRKLNKASKRGVKIRIVIPSDTDHKFVNYVHKGYYQQLLRMEVSLFATPQMIHTKLIIVDDDWATFGSANCDSLSLVYNHELNFASTDQDLISKLQKYSQRFFKEEYLIEKNNLKRSLWEKLKVHLYKMLRFLT